MNQINFENLKTEIESDIKLVNSISISSTSLFSSKNKSKSTKFFDVFKRTMKNVTN